jgi:hypothetical protein
MTEPDVEPSCEILTHSSTAAPALSHCGHSGTSCITWSESPLAAAPVRYSPAPLPLCTASRKRGRGAFERLYRRAQLAPLLPLNDLLIFSRDEIANFSWFL